MEGPSFPLESTDFSMMHSRNVNRTTSVVQELPPLGAKTIRTKNIPQAEPERSLEAKKAMIDFQILKSSCNIPPCVKWAKIIN
jgi:hypothetical protein